MIEMTREEYERKFGVRPPAGSSMSEDHSIIDELKRTSGGYSSSNTDKRPTANKVTDFLGLKGATDLVGASLASSPLNPTVPSEAKKYVEFPTGKEALGAGISGLALAVPGGAGKNLAAKAALGAGAGYMMDVGSNLQKNKGLVESLTPGIGTVSGAAFPLAAKGVSIAGKMFGSLFKGVGSGLSGASQQQMEALLADPETAARVSAELARTGDQEVVKRNAETIVNGIANARKQARSVYGDALEKLAAEDIKPSVFRSKTQEFLDSWGVSLKNGERTLENVEFADPKNLQKASDLIDRLSNTDLDGRSLRKLSDDVESAMYKTATSDERLSFNAFLKEMGQTIRAAINESTPKLKAMDAAYSKDMQLLEATQNIFGDVNYKNLPEVLRASKRLEGLFRQTGMAPTVIDDFLKRIGVDATQFRAGEAARQMGNLEQKANPPGLNPVEIVRSVTSAVVSPKLVRDITIATGASEKAIRPFLEALSAPARTAVIQALLHNQTSQEGMEEEVAPGTQE